MGSRNVLRGKLAFGYTRDDGPYPGPGWFASIRCPVQLVPPAIVQHKEQVISTDFI